MEQYPENYTKQLQRLLLICNDGKEGYHQAAEQAESQELKEIFETYSNQRAQMANELRERIQSMGGTADNEDGDNAGRLHRAAMSFKTAFTKGVKDDQAVLESCRSGEQAALDTYDQVLQGSILETDLKPFITSQRTEISEAYYKIDKLYFDMFKSDPEKK